VLGTTPKLRRKAALKVERSNAFRWRAEVSRNGGRSWVATVEFRATRAAT